MNIITFAGAALIISLLVVILRQQKPEFGLVVTICAGGILMAAIIDGLLPAVKDIGNMISGTVAAGYLPPVLKAFGVCLVTRLAADICRDAGQQTVASHVETAGKLAMLVIALPLLSTVLNSAQGIIKG